MSAPAAPVTATLVMNEEPTLSYRTIRGTLEANHTQRWKWKVDILYACLSSGHQSQRWHASYGALLVLKHSNLTMKILTILLLVVVLSITTPPIAGDRRRAFTPSSLTSSISISQTHRFADRTKQRAASAFVETDVDVASSSTTPATDVRGGGGGTATMSNEMFNMVKAVVGVGVLSLPAGENSRE